jgi:hypothetical protein
MRFMAARIAIGKLGQPPRSPVSQASNAVTQKKCNRRRVEPTYS